MCLAASHAYAQEASPVPSKIYSVSACRQAPVINGKLDEAAWKKALKFPEFFKRRTDKPAAVPTTAYLTFDKDNLYVGFTCPYPKNERLKRRFKNRDDSFWDDDECVEFFVDPTGAGCTYYHFGINPNGALTDLRHASDKKTGPWDAPGARAAVYHEKGSWSVELMIPFKDLGETPDGIQLWHMNFARERRTREAEELSSSTGHFHKGKAFHPVRFEGLGKNKEVYVLSIGGLTLYHNYTGGNVFSVMKPAGAGPVRASVRQVLDGQKTLVEEKASAGNGKAEMVEIPYTVKGIEGEAFIFEVKNKQGKTLFNKQVKQTTGYGKYGLPEAENDENPFRWIAWFRYYNKESQRIWSQLRSDVKEIYPYKRFMGEDSSAAFKPLEYTQSAELDICDFYNHQTSPGRGGHIVKLLADLTGKEVFPCTHVEHYFGSYNPEEVREIVSREFRAGASGFVFYTTDSTHRGANMVTMEFSAPERWNAVLEIMDRVQKQPKLKYPQADFGVFYCNTSYQAINPFINAWWDLEMQYAYEIFGPKLLKSWWQFFDEYTLLNHPKKLAGCKAIMINFGKYQLPGVMEKLEAYVKNGGVILCFDPEAFSWSADGKSLKEARRKLFGVKVGELSEDKQTVTLVDSSLGIAKGTQLPALSDYCALQAVKGATVVAEFSNGKPAIVEKKLGKGRTYFFGFNPVTSSAAREAKWKQAFVSMSQALGIKTDQEIWRFTFPPYKNKLYPDDPEGVCLTGNYQRFVNDLPVMMRNLDTGGSYKLSPTADLYTDEGGKGDVLFTQGDLTDRCFAYAKNAKPGSSKGYVVSWKDNVPIEIVFDFKKPCPINRVRIYYNERLPRFKIQVSKDGRQWNDAAQRDEEQQSDGVRLVERNFPAQTAQYVKISFAKRDKDWKHKRPPMVKKKLKKPPKEIPEYLCLVEIEVWAQKKKSK